MPSLQDAGYQGEVAVEKDCVDTPRSLAACDACGVDPAELLGIGAGEALNEYARGVLLQQARAAYKRLLPPPPPPRQAGGREKPRRAVSGKAEDFALAAMVKHELRALAASKTVEAKLAQSEAIRRTRLADRAARQHAQTVHRDQRAHDGRRAAAEARTLRDAFALSASAAKDQAQAAAAEACAARNHGKAAEIRSAIAQKQTEVIARRQALDEYWQEKLHAGIEGKHARGARAADRAQQQRQAALGDRRETRARRERRARRVKERLDQADAVGPQLPRGRPRPTRCEGAEAVGRPPARRIPLASRAAARLRPPPPAA
ncbi:hypothetical protein DIPPA_08712 [Diplonema papillatum]|nr:hypothetical protein DIPPA_08712 [Diplonema papillatum]